MTAELDCLSWLRDLTGDLGGLFAELDQREERWTRRILEAYKRVGLAQHHFAATTGYGYNDPGREALESVFADLFGAEAALVRQQIVSGTHAINLCLQALAIPGKEILFAGEPYDTLQEAVGLRGAAPGNIRDRGAIIRVVSMPETFSSWTDALAAEIGEATSLIYLQRSGGYTDRPALPAAIIRRICDRIKNRCGHPLIFVDNCYGEFVEDLEPTECGADLAAGSLIKNPGGGLAPSGGYVVGRLELLERVAAQLYAPGLAREVGPSLLSPRVLFQGLFQAPHLVGQALRGAILCARAMSELGFEVGPAWNEPRSDIVQRLVFDNEDELLAFAQAVQSASPVDANARLEPACLPGYNDPIIMAGGTFVQGSSSELTIDAPVRPPFAGYWQGGLSFIHARYALALGIGTLKSLPPAIIKRKTETPTRLPTTEEV